jgi:hypothetical protein
VCGARNHKATAFLFTIDTIEPAMAIDWNGDASAIAAWWTLGLALFALLVALVAGYFYVWPAWRLLALALHGKDTPRKYLRALRPLSSFFKPGLLSRSGSLFKSARMRIEMEALLPLNDPEAPSRLDFEDDGKYHEARHEWRTLQKERNAQIKRRTLELIISDDAQVIEVDALSDLIDHDGIKRYFDALFVVRPAEADPPSFLSTVQIASGFLAPLHLLTGVLQRYNDEWKPIVEGYGTTITDDTSEGGAGKPFREIKSSTFAIWLLWGPSIPLCRCSSLER